MTTISVMGTALINAIGVDKQAPSGSLLTLRSKDSDRISEDFTVTKIENDLISVNWIKDEPSLVSEVVTKADFVEFSETERIKMLSKYIENNNLSPNWVRTTRYELGISI